MHKIGSFTTTSGSLILSDPACARASSAGVLEHAMSGSWEVFADFTSLDPWGEVCRFLLAVHEDYSERSPWLHSSWAKLPFIIEVNSGQVGIFDSLVYQAGEHEQSVTSAACSDWFYTCDDLTAEREAGVISGGAVSLSGTGNGHYGAYCVYNDQQQIVAVKIVYVKSPED